MTRPIPEWERQFLDLFDQRMIECTGREPTWQDFREPITEEGIPVRMQVGGQAIVVIGWLHAPDGVPGLLREVADQVERIQDDGA